MNVATGIATLEPELVDVLRSMRASNREVLMKVGIPRSLPYLFASLKVAITLSFVGSVLAETIGGNAGLGYLMVTASARSTSLVFAASSPSRSSPSACTPSAADQSGDAMGVPRRAGLMSHAMTQPAIEIAPRRPSKALRIAIAGFGSIGRLVGRHLDQGLAGLQLVGVSARDIDRARNALEGYRTPVKAVPLARIADDADVVVECTPSSVFATR